MNNNGTKPNSEEALYHKSRVERVKEYVSANLAADLNIGTVAANFGLNKITLRHVFKKEQQESYRNFVERKRMEKALQLLKEGKWVKEVMPATGYKNRSTFNNAFIKAFKHPPSHFKK
jgi:two-component system, response regulator YesN